MKTLLVLTVVTVGWLSFGSVAPEAAACEAVGEIQFICDLIGPEDLAIVPGGEWVVASGNQAGGRIHLIHVRDKTATVLFPSSTQAERFDGIAYPSCPGPLNLPEPDVFRAHGLYLQRGEGQIHNLYVVHHGVRESIEVFEVDAGGSPPELAWVGCAVAPEALRFNSVVALPEGGLAATSPQTDDVWEWHAETGWHQVPGSGGTAPNGLEVSPDGRWFFVAGWREEKLTRLSRGRTPVEKAVVDIGFRPDNLRLAVDGTRIFAAGHGNYRTPQETSNVAVIDPQTLAVERIFQHARIDGFEASTTAIQVGNEIWLGTNRGSMVAYFPAPD